MDYHKLFRMYPSLRNYKKIAGGNVNNICYICMLLLCSFFRAFNSEKYFFYQFHVIFYAQASCQTSRLIITREYIQINKKLQSRQSVCPSKMRISPELRMHSRKKKNFMRIVVVTPTVVQMKMLILSFIQSESKRERQVFYTSGENQMA